MSADIGTQGRQKTRSADRIASSDHNQISEPVGTWDLTIHLRPYQSHDVTRIRAAFAVPHRSVLYVAPTGSGKTVLFAYIAAALAQRGRRAWILVHRQELLTQTSRTLTEFSVPHGLIAPQFSFDRSQALQVASVQTLVRRMDRLAPPDMIIVDEAHHAISPTWRRVISEAPQAKILGVTATPLRLDGKGLGDVFDAMVIGPSAHELTEQGYLAPATIYAPPSMIDMAGVGKVAGDYARGQTADRVDRPTITGDAVAHYRRICDGVPAVCFCVSVVHAWHVAEQFRAAGYRAASVDGSMDDRTRRGAISGLVDGRAQILCSCDLISEGLDIPVVTAAILLRPTHSLALARQQMGRALRPAVGKTRAIILDHCGNVLKHGLPTDEIEWTLEGVKPRGKSDRERAVSVRQCPSCYAVSPASAAVCRECAVAFPVNPREVEQREGELVELDEIRADLAKAAKQREVQIARDRTALERIARERGYRPGWVDYVLAARAKTLTRASVSQYATIKQMKGEMG